MSRISRTATPNLPANSVLSYPGIDPTGVTDSTAGLLAANKAQYELKAPAYVPEGRYKIGTAGTGLTLGSQWSTLAIKPSEGFYPSLICDPGVIFEGQAALGTNPVVDLAPTKAQLEANNLLMFPTVRLGVVTQASATGACVRANASESADVYWRLLEKGFAGVHLLSTEGLGTEFTGNGTCTFGAINRCKNGILLESGLEGPGIGVQGWTFNGDIIQLCETGIFADGEVGHNSRWNTFRIGVIGQSGVELWEGNPGWGIINKGLYNKYEIGIGTGNTAGDALILSRCYVRMWAETGITVEAGVLADVWDLKLEPRAPVKQIEIAIPGKPSEQPPEHEVISGEAGTAGLPKAIIVSERGAASKVFKKVVHNLATDLVTVTAWLWNGAHWLPVAVTTWKPETENELEVELTAEGRKRITAKAPTANTVIGSATINMTGSEASGYVNGRIAYTTTLTTGVTGLAKKTRYVIVEAAANSFALAATPGGAAIKVAGHELEKGSTTIEVLPDEFQLEVKA